MALIDFGQLAILYKLARSHEELLSDNSPPSPMPQPYTRCVTPPAYGSSLIHKLDPEPAQPQKRTSSKYEEYIAQDFNRHRVFVDMEVFMKHVLHVPDDWEELWGPTIKTIKDDLSFKHSLSKYLLCCDSPSVTEVNFYEPLVDTANAIFSVTESSNSDEAVKPRTRLRYLRNDPKRVLGGMMHDLSPDIVAVHADFFDRLPQKDRDAKRLGKSRLTWAQPLQVLEVKPWNSALVDGSYMPRLMVDGEQRVDICVGTRTKQE